MIRRRRRRSKRWKKKHHNLQLVDFPQNAEICSKIMKSSQCVQRKKTYVRENGLLEEN